MWTSFRALRRKHGKNIEFVSVDTPTVDDIIGIYNTSSKQLLVGVIKQVDDNAVKIAKGKWVRLDRDGYKINFHRIVKTNGPT